MSTSKHSRGMQYRLPTGRAWSGEIMVATLDGIAEELDRIEEETVDVASVDNNLFGDGRVAWQEALNLPAAGTDDEQNAAIVQKLNNVGDMSPAGLQKAMRDAGFDVYVHKNSFPDLVVDNSLGGDDTILGDDNYVLASDTSSQIDPRNYLSGSNTAELVINHILPDEEDTDDLGAFLGDDSSYLGDDDYVLNPIPEITIPGDPELWSYVYFIGGQNFDDRATVPAERRNELRQLIIETKPLSMWAFLLIDYV